jgi:hypothetical protein
MTSFWNINNDIFWLETTILQVQNEIDIARTSCTNDESISNMNKVQLLQDYQQKLKVLLSLNKS